MSFHYPHGRNAPGGKGQWRDSSGALRQCCESLGVEGDKPNGAEARSSGELGVHKNWEAECKALLSSTTMSIQQIADTLNFPSQSVFGKYFKRATGMSPREYRNRG